MKSRITRPSVVPALGLVWALAASVSIAANAVELPPRNPFLADSVYALGHGESAQQDASTLR